MTFSCIMTTFNDGPLIRQSVQSVLNQTYGDFELLIVDDGSQPETQAILAEFDDPRITVLPQANDGLSSARNRGLHHAKGDYICFLDADDTRAPWAFAEVAAAIEATGAELLFVRGALAAERSELRLFLDETHFEGYEADVAKTGTSDLAMRKAWAYSLEPQSANKFIARDVIERGALRFPNDHFFEDILFHTMVIAHAQSVELLNARSFTYFQRALRPQLTGANNTTRFDILGTARVTFQMFETLPGFADARQRGAVALNLLRLLKWCEDCIPVFHRKAYRGTLQHMLSDVNPMFFVIDDTTPDPRGDRGRLMQYTRDLLA